MYLFKLQVASNLAIINELHLLSVRKIHLFEHVFCCYITKNSSSSREATSALDFRMTTPQGLWKRKQQVFLFSDYVRNQNFSYHSFYRNIRERNICVVNTKLRTDFDATPNDNEPGLVLIFKF